MDDYAAFLESKRAEARPAGFDPTDLNPNLFLFQREIVRWACRLGRAAVFADTGLGKTLMQLAWADAVSRHTMGGKVLILTPLAVAPQTVREGKRFGIGVAEASEQADVDAQKGVWVTNYEKLHKFDPSYFAGIVLDESSILKAYAGKTKLALVAAFRDTAFRLCCTATPAPNDHDELGNHAEFLGIMPSSEMLTRWFTVDQAHAGEYRLKGHAAADFWRWVASWSVCLSKPSDLGMGHPDDGYDLPPLEIVEHCVPVDARDESGKSLWRDGQLNATGLHREMRRTAADRAEAVAGLVKSKPGPWVVWCNTDYEADELAERLPDATEVRGSDREAFKARALADFSDGKIGVLITKPTVAGFGLNWQHCHQQAFVGLSYSFEQYYQALRRCWRFGQQHPVEAHVFFAETEGPVVVTIKRKQERAAEQRAELVAAVREHWRAFNAGPTLKMDYAAHVEKGEGWELRLGDCVDVTKTLPDNSVDFTIFSPPFSNLYVYSDSYRDMGNAADDAEFFEHLGYLIPELHRVTVPGRLCAVHCKDLPAYRNRDGASALRDFPGELIRAFTAAGWAYHSRVTIWKCPVTERERTNNNGLLHKTVMRDSSQIRQGMPDYLIVFRKTPEGSNLSAKPIERPAGFTRWVGEQAYDPRQGNAYHPSPFARKPGGRPRMADAGGKMVDLTPSVNVWQRYADPVWWDVRQMDVLNVELARADKDEKHICPLQLGVIERAIELWTNPGDLVLTPFAGIGSEVYQSVRMGRRGLGVELKDTYFRVACQNAARAESESRQVGLYDFLPNPESCPA